MKLTWFGHSAYRLEFGSSVVLIDPFLTGNPSFKGDPAQASAGATHVLLTHGHADHVGDALAISQRTGAKVVANYEICMWLARQGLKAMDPMNSGGTTDQGEFSVTLTIAFHSSAQLDENGISHDLGLPHGVVVTPKAAGEPTVYHMGDTEVFSDMALIDELHKPAVAIVPVGDRFTMDGKRGALAVRRFLPSVRTAIPCHWGTFPIIAPNPDGFVAAMQGAEAKVLVPQVGVAVTL
ncbi:metal-dependent hydrolase [Falsiroseomonas oryzae]|uniref:metal-dependent hydrolase n=1 Tax=Falsiroseomonas oryzae TaxID=2766473 RepID=UPI0022EA95C8|nr:metal-dependent hydrolase [Roseomonas sp. MO-31]